MPKFQEIRISDSRYGAIVIREAQIAEACQLTDFLVAMSRTSDSFPVLPEEVKGAPQDDEQWLASFRKGLNLMLVALLDDTIIANCDIVVSDLQMFAHTGLISVNVSESFRGQALGRKLLDTMINWVVNCGKIESLWLNVLSNNDIAVKLYTSFGFREVGRQPRFVKTQEGLYHDNIIMSKVLK